jgi:hypothetical protein
MTTIVREDFTQFNTNDLSGAMTVMLRWIDEVLKTMVTIRWTKYGKDGSLHMVSVNPNKNITILLYRYEIHAMIACNTILETLRKYTAEQGSPFAYVLKWINSVIKLSKCFKWPEDTSKKTRGLPVAYHTKNNQPDLSRPVYGVDNPNNSIDDLFKDYSTNIMGYLSMILNTLSDRLDPLNEAIEKDAREKEARKKDELLARLEKAKQERQARKEQQRLAAEKQALEKQVAEKQAAEKQSAEKKNEVRQSAARKEGHKKVASGPECEFCGSNDNITKYCSRCRLVHYCSRACQSSHWKRTHRAQCILPSERRPEAVMASAKDQVDHQGDQCTVCFESLSLHQEATLACGHHLHESCLQNIRARETLSNLCPVCRASI